MSHTSDRANRLRTPAALLGACAVVAMGAIGLMTGGLSDGQAAVASGGGSMTTGETTTLTFSGTVKPVVNVPPVKATFFGEG